MDNNICCEELMKPADYKSDVTPIWCPGCGHFGVFAAITKALADLQLARENVAIVSGIGCSSRIPAYASVYGFHGLHGRALPIASGLKLARPELTVLVAGGDGDGFSIGGNHFLHACRRNVDMTYIVMDNEIYGMTKGQASPTTAPDWTGSDLTPHGTGVPIFRPLEIALAAGASHVVRAYAGKLPLLTQYIKDAIQHPGFSFIHVLGHCVTFRKDLKGLKDMVHEGFQVTSDRREARKQMLDDDGFTTGVLFKSDEPPFKSFQDSPVAVSELGKQFVL